MSTTQKYAPHGMALAYVQPGEYRIRRGNSCGEEWVYLYSGRRRVWDCNPIFFREWFEEVKP